MADLCFYSSKTASINVTMVWSLGRMPTIFSAYTVEKLRELTLGASLDRRTE